MYSQFFGNYLLSKQLATTEQMVRAIEEQHSKHLKIGTMAIRAGYMTLSQIDDVIVSQTHTDKRFGEIAIEKKYLTKDQVAELLAAQTPDYLLLGQALVEQGVFSEAEMEMHIKSYQKENRISHLEQDQEQSDNLQMLIRNLFLITIDEIPDYLTKYLNLLFNNLLRFIGEDFTPLNPSIVSEYVTGRCASQAINGEYQITSYMDMAEDAAIAFASRYVNDTFTGYDEYVQASIEDFLNLHNGLFNVNISNENSRVELFLEPPVTMDNTMISCSVETFLLPIIYPFGIINLLISVSEKKNSILQKMEDSTDALNNLDDLDALLHDIENMS